MNAVKVKGNIHNRISKIVKSEGYTEMLDSEVVRHERGFITLAFSLGHLPIAFLIFDGNIGYWCYRSENLPYHKVFCSDTLDEAVDRMLKEWWEFHFA